MVMAFISLINTVFSYYDVDLPISEEAAILSGELAMQMLNEALCNIAEL